MDSVTTEKSPNRRLLAGRIEDIKPGNKKIVRDRHEDILVVNVKGEFFAVSSLCPHAGGFMGYGFLEGYMLECPMHYWEFDLRNGCLLGMENADWYERLNTYTVTLEEGQVFVELPPGV